MSLTNGTFRLSNSSGILLSNAATNPIPVAAPAVMLTFDDGWATNYTEVYTYMHAKGMKGTLYIVTSAVGAGSSVSEAQIIEMDAAGWDMANHCVDHTDLTTLNQAAQQTKLSSAQTYLDSIGLTRASRHVGYPFGRYNADTLAAMTALDMLTGRTIQTTLANLPPSNAFTIPSYNFDTTVTLNQAKAIIDSAVTQNKIVCAYLHDIQASPDQYGWTTANFRGLVDYIETLGLPTITINEYYTGVYA